MCATSVIFHSSKILFIIAFLETLVKKRLHGDKMESKWAVISSISSNFSFYICFRGLP